MQVSPSLVISTCALLFTAFAFWWMNWRPGRLLVAPPRCGAAANTETMLLLEFPFVFFNTGPLPKIILNLRIVLAEGSPLEFVATVGKLATDKDRALATQFMVRGREGLSLICEFQRRGGGRLSPGTYTAELQGLLFKKRGWRKLCSFGADLQNLSDHLATFDNMKDRSE